MEKMYSDIKDSPNVTVFGEAYLRYDRRETSSSEIVNSSSLRDYALEKFYKDKDEINSHEKFVILAIDSGMKPLGFCEIGVGGTTAVYVDVKQIVKFTCISSAKSIAIFHNHPSGRGNVSKSDIDLTKKIAEIAHLLDVSLLDHVILYVDKYDSLCYTSFADDGIMPNIKKN